MPEASEPEGHADGPDRQHVGGGAEELDAALAVPQRHRHRGPDDQRNHGQGNPEADAKRLGLTVHRTRQAMAAAGRLCQTQPRPNLDHGTPAISATSPPTPDGEPWVADSATRRNGSHAAPRRQTIDRLVVLGYIAAISMPPIGFVLAVVIGFRDTQANLKHALLIFTLGLIACALWALAISSGALTATDSSV